MKKLFLKQKLKTLLKDKFTEPTQPIVLAYSFTKKADPAKANYYVKIANGDLSTQAQIVAAKLVRESINENKLNKKSAVYKKLVAADAKVAAAEAKLTATAPTTPVTPTTPDTGTVVTDTTPATLATSSAKLLVEDNAAVTTDEDAVYLTFSEPVYIKGDLTLKTKNGIATQLET